MSKLILCPDADTSPCIRSSDQGSCAEMIWETGLLMNADDYDFSRLEFICETPLAGDFPDYAVSDMGCSVVSERFKLFLSSMGINNIQYFSATVIEREGELPKPGFYAANIVGLIDCIDRDASEMDAEVDDNGELNIIYSIDKLVLKPLPVNHCIIYRAHPFTRLILIDQVAKQKIEQASLAGIKLISPERWDGINGEI